MFAFAIWDARRRRLLLARDRLGVKPLLYALLPQGLVFGSEVRAILRHPAVHAELDEDAFYDYLTFAFAPPPAHPVQGHPQAGRGRVHGGGRRRRDPARALLVALVRRGLRRGPRPWARRRW